MSTITRSRVTRFYAALGQGRVLAERCEDCTTITFPPTGCCEACGGYALHEFQLTGRGTLLFASHNTAPACHPRFNPYAPYVYGQVELEEGVFTSGIVRDVPGTPEAARELYERGPLPVVVDVLATEDLPVVAFRIVG
jgi:uncharacterized OB-fold protein